MIVLLNPPSPPGFTSNKDTMGGFGQVYPGDTSAFVPLDILYAAASLRSAKKEFILIESLTSRFDIKNLINTFSSIECSRIVLRTSLQTLEWDIEVAQIIKAVSKADVIFTGPIVKYMATRILKSKCVDFIIVGEYENEDVIIPLASGENPKKIVGAWYLIDEKLIKNGESKIVNLDYLPFPAWDLIKPSNINKNQLAENKIFITMQTSRGCCYNCSYCPYSSIQGSQMRFRAVRLVVDELEYFSKLGIPFVLFRDPEFLVNKERSFEIFKEIIKRKIEIEWRCETRIEDLSHEMIALMKKAGCTGVNFGIESGDKDILSLSGRKLPNLEIAKNIVKSCKKAGIKTFSFFIIGLPQDTRTSIYKTLKYAIKLSPDIAQFSVATPYPGTKIYDYLQSKGLITNAPLIHYSGYEAVSSNDNLTHEQIQQLKNNIDKIWAIHKTNIIKFIAKQIFTMFDYAFSYIYWNIIKKLPQ